LEQGHFTVGKGDVCVVYNSGMEGVFVLWCHCAIVVIFSFLSEVLYLVCFLTEFFLNRTLNVWPGVVPNVG